MIALCQCHIYNTPAYLARGAKYSNDHRRD
jgi:hypothetical protein